MVIYKGKFIVMLCFFIARLLLYVTKKYFLLTRNDWRFLVTGKKCRQIFCNDVFFLVSRV